MLSLGEMPSGRVPESGASWLPDATRCGPLRRQQPKRAGLVARQLFANELAEPGSHLSIARPSREASRRHLRLAVATLDQPMEHIGELLVDLPAPADLNEVQVRHAFGHLPKESTRQLDVTALRPVAANPTAALGTGWPSPNRTDGASAGRHAALEPLDDRFVLPAHDHRALRVDPDEPSPFRVDRPVGHHTLTQTWRCHAPRVCSADASFARWHVRVHADAAKRVHAWELGAQHALGEARQRRASIPRVGPAV